MSVTDLLALAIGFGLGAIFALLRLPVPAPSTLGGILGVVGVALGAYVVNLIR